MKELKLEDYPIIKPYLDLANYEGYNSIVIFAYGYTKRCNNDDVES